MRLKRALGAIVAAALLAGCANMPQTEKAVTFEDSTGREISVDVHPKRVAALTGSFADVWCTAGGKDELVAAADDTWTSFDLDLGDDVQNLGAIHEPNVEVLLASKPDFVLASAKNDADKKIAETLESQNIPVACFDISNFDDYLNMLKICTELTGDSEAYKKYGTDQQAEIDKDIEFAKSQEGPTVLYLRATRKGVTAKNSKGSVLGEMLAQLNTVNVADSDKALLENLSAEAILKANPDKIFIVCQGSDDTKAKAQLEKTLTSRPAWSQLKAVKDGQVYMMDQSLYNLKPNARWAEAMSHLTELLYGEVR